MRCLVRSFVWCEMWDVSEGIEIDSRRTSVSVIGAWQWLQPQNSYRFEVQFIEFDYCRFLFNWQIARSQNTIYKMHPNSVPGISIVDLNTSTHTHSALWIFNELNDGMLINVRLFLAHCTHCVFTFALILYVRNLGFIFGLTMLSYLFYKLIKCGSVCCQSSEFVLSSPFFLHILQNRKSYSFALL